MKNEDLSALKSWTLFLDRDGVINKRRIGNYVEHIEQFQFIPGVLDALNLLSSIFGRTIIVTNQQGIGKGLMTEEDLHKIHAYLVTTVSRHGGKIDHIYHAPDLADHNSPFRKPNIGMALQAKIDFPEIDFNRSIMVGDSISDLEFGRRAGMTTIFIRRKHQVLKPGLADYLIDDLLSLANQDRLKKVCQISET